eukprot:CAMPEP_0179224320 /NCGR_PEP_ID=MMETSP0797-20121207/7718_1 /TAXON_ID=47934 /ORGANISM="Dinophysis acuminata, Strain DAEP01" /LENGTH=48 /DNA_ID= /DNA_START= /DNA_END= /DNA_ORIENTATION=
MERAARRGETTGCTIETHCAQTKIHFASAVAVWGGAEAAAMEAERALA